MSSDLINESLVWRASTKGFFHSLLGIGREMMKKYIVGEGCGCGRGCGQMRKGARV